MGLNLFNFCRVRATPDESFAQNISRPEASAENVYSFWKTELTGFSDPSAPIIQQSLIVQPYLRDDAVFLLRHDFMGFLPLPLFGYP